MFLALTKSENTKNYKIVKNRHIFYNAACGYECYEQMVVVDTDTVGSHAAMMIVFDATPLAL